MEKYAVVEFGTSSRQYTYANDIEATVGWECGNARVVGLVDSISFDPSKLKGLSSIQKPKEIAPSNPLLSIESINSKIAVVDQASMDKAGEYISVINSRIKVVKEHYEPMKKKAYEAHKAITQQEKDTLAPLEQAVVEIKNSINQYVTAEREKARLEQERLRKEQQELQEKARQELLEQERQLELAKQFDNEQAQQEIVANIEKQVDVIIEKPVIVELPKSSNVIYVDSYEIVVKDNQKVPTHICGVEIRPIDTALIKKYAKDWVKSGIEIPGIEIVKTQSIRAKR